MARKHNLGTHVSLKHSLFHAFGLGLGLRVIGLTLTPKAWHRLCLTLGLRVDPNFMP